MLYNADSVLKNIPFTVSREMTSRIFGSIPFADQYHTLLICFVERKNSCSSTKCNR